MDAEDVLATVLNALEDFNEVSDVLAYDRAPLVRTHGSEINVGRVRYNNHHEYNIVVQRVPDSPLPVPTGATDMGGWIVHFDDFVVTLQEGAVATDKDGGTWRLVKGWWERVDR